VPSAGVTLGHVQSCVAFLLRGQLRGLAVLVLFRSTGGSTNHSQAALLKLQRDDNGWSQKSDMDSDVYATGTVLVTLLEAGVSSDEEPIRRGVKYLLENQKDDGTDQFISIAAGDCRAACFPDRDRCASFAREH
jgi:hypothetical protein